MQESVVGLLNNYKQTKSMWENVGSGNHGTITKGNSITRNNQQCHEVTLNNHFGSEKEILKELMCIDGKGLWKVI